MKAARNYGWHERCRRRLSLTVTREITDSVPADGLFFRWVFAAMCEEFSYGAIGILLCSPVRAKYYNEYYRGKNYPTNVLSFPLNTQTRPDCLSGDLIMCPQVVAQEAAEQKKNLTAHYAHLTVHGILHLMGHDHLAANEAGIMETKEIALLRAMGIKNPYEV